jgi:hypothetical protein
MAETPVESKGMRLSSRSGLCVEVNANGSLRRFDYEAISLLLFPGNEIEGGPANLYLRCRIAAIACEWTPLLGPMQPHSLRPGCHRTACWLGPAQMASASVIR